MRYNIHLNDVRIAAEAAYLVGCNNIENSFHDKVYFSALIRSGYKVWKVVVVLRENGFDALVLRNTEGDVIIRDGTGLWNYRQMRIQLDAKQKEIAKLELINMLQDLINDLGIILRKIPRQYKAAETFVAQIIGQIPRTKIILTGHSLGGLLAQLVSVKFGLRAIVFDSPGAKKFIDRLCLSCACFKKISIVNVFPNFINSYGEHLVQPLALNNGGILAPYMLRNFVMTFPLRTGKGGKKYLVSHSMCDILNNIDEDDIFRIIPIQKWPKSLMGLYILLKKRIQGR